MHPQKSNHQHSTNTKLITSYFTNDNSQQTLILPSPTNIPQSSPMSKLQIKSRSIKLFVVKEGAAYFEVVKQQQSALPNVMDLCESKHYLLRCRIRGKFASCSSTKCKYVRGIVISQSEYTSKSFMKSIKRGLEKHVNDTLIHAQCVSLQNIKNKPSAALYIKVETAFFMVKRSTPTIVFEEILVYLSRLINYFGCDKMTIVSILENTNIQSKKLNAL